MLNTKIVAALFGLLVALQNLFAQGDHLVQAKKKQLEDQIVLMREKYEKLGLSNEQIEEKLASYLEMQVDEKSSDGSASKKLLIAGAGLLAFICIAYLSYKLYQEKKEAGLVALICIAYLSSKLYQRYNNNEDQLKKDLGNSFG